MWEIGATDLAWITNCCCCCAGLGRSDFSPWLCCGFLDRSFREARGEREIGLLMRQSRENDTEKILV